jgi:hypothetical protein
MDFVISLNENIILMRYSWTLEYMYAQSYFFTVIF